MANQIRAAAPDAAPSTTLPRRRATSYDVARQAGVAQSTVSRSFRNDSAISAETRELVLEVARTVGYMPNALARSMITKRSNLVGVVATNYTLRGNPEAIYAIGEALAAAGKQLLLMTAPHDNPTIADLRGGLEYPLDGLISCVQLSDPDIKTLQERHLALVLYNRRSPRIPVDSVTANHGAAAAKMARALHAAGHRRFLCVGGPSAAPVSRERVEGFLHQLLAFGIKNIPMVETDYSYAGGRDGFLAQMKGAKVPEAVFCASDQIAFGVLDACRFTLGLEVPKDISVVGFDDVPEAARPGYDLTTMHQDRVDMARQAVGLLLQRLAAPESSVMHAQVTASFVRRGSAKLE